MRCNADAGRPIFAPMSASLAEQWLNEAKARGVKPSGRSLPPEFSAATFDHIAADRSLAKAARERRKQWPAAFRAPSIKQQDATPPPTDSSSSSSRCYSSQSHSSPVAQQLNKTPVSKPQPFLSPATTSGGAQKNLRSRRDQFTPQRMPTPRVEEENESAIKRLPSQLIADLAALAPPHTIPPMLSPDGAPRDSSACSSSQPESGTRTASSASDRITPPPPPTLIQTSTPPSNPHLRSPKARKPAPTPHLDALLDLPLPPSIPSYLNYSPPPDNTKADAAAQTDAPPNTFTPRRPTSGRTITPRSLQPPPRTAPLPARGRLKQPTATSRGVPIVSVRLTKFQSL